MRSHPLTAADRIIVPLDVSTEAEAVELIEAIPEVQFWKVGLELFVSCGPNILEQLKRRHKKIFLDLKFHDIPNTVAGACRAAGRYGVDLLTLHATAGKEAIAAGVEAAKDGAAQAQVRPPSVVAITLLTSISHRTLAMDLKIPIELPEFALAMALMAQESGTQGVVCSPHEAEQLRQICGNDFLLVCPGVRPAGSQVGDQRRVMTPGDAMQAGADYLVIGRPITQATNPAIAFESIRQDIASHA
ncbi:MAG: orotidine-5'-phosphate decarboxylase [Cyanobacteria bacterium P01_F01_bin.42]